MACGVAPTGLAALALLVALGRSGAGAAPAAGPSVAPRPVAAELPKAVQPPLRVRGRHVVDSTGQRVFLACVNWYGAHLHQMAANGLNRQPVAKIAETIADFGFNCVRLPFSLEMVFGSYTQVPDPNVSLAANPELHGLTPLEVFDATLSALTDKGIMVVLNNHVSNSTWCCKLTDGEGLWYTTDYPEEMWVRGVREMAARYRGNPLVVGFDLRNEIRPSALGTPTWGTGDSASDWSMAAVKGAQEVVAVNEGMLIIISGLYFSIFLCDVPRRPVHDMVPSLHGRTIYTSHEYKWVNFHLVARAVVGSYFVTIVLWWAGLWILGALGWSLGSSRCLAPDENRPCCGALRRRASCCCRPCCGCRPGRVLRTAELLAAIVLTSMSLGMLCVTEFFMDKCGVQHLVVSMGFLFIAFLFCMVSMVLWMRVAITCVKWSQEALDLREVELASPVSGVAHGDLRCQEDLTPDARGDMLDLPIGRRRTCLQLVTRSKRCLAFMVSGLLLTSLGILWMLYGRYEAFAGEVDSRWGFLVRGAPLNGADAAATEAPVWVGEFGTDVDDLWWQHMLRYMGERELAGWAYWSINGQKTNSRPERFGLLMEDSATVRHPWKLKALQRLIRAAGPVRALPRQAREPSELLS